MDSPHNGPDTLLDKQGRPRVLYGAYCVNQSRDRRDGAGCDVPFPPRP